MLLVRNLNFVIGIISVTLSFFLSGCSADAILTPTTIAMYTFVPTFTASPHLTDTPEPIVTVIHTITPTDTPTPTPISTVTPDPLRFTVEELLFTQSSWQPDPTFEDCGVGPVSLLCPKDWFVLEAEPKITFASNESLLEGYGINDQGGQIHVSIFSVFDLQVAAPEDVLPDFMESMFPSEASRQIIDGPVIFSLNGYDAAAIMLQSDVKAPELVALLVAVQQNGRIITIAAITSSDVASELLPEMAKGITALEVDIETRSHYLLPAGSTAGTMNTLDGSSPNFMSVFTRSDQMIFMMVDPDSPNMNVRLELVDPKTNRVIASSDRNGTEYIFYHLDQSGEYDFVIHSDQPGLYSSLLIAPKGGAPAINFGPNEFFSRLESDSSLSYVLTANNGEHVDIIIIPEQAALDLIVKVFSVNNGDTPLLVIDDVGAGGTEAFTFHPPEVDLYLLAVEEKNASAGTFTVLVEYR